MLVSTLHWHWYNDTYSSHDKGHCTFWNDGLEIIREMSSKRVIILIEIVQADTLYAWMREIACSALWRYQKIVTRRKTWIVYFSVFGSFKIHTAFQHILNLTLNDTLFLQLVSHKDLICHKDRWVENSNHCTSNSLEFSSRCWTFSKNLNNIRSVSVRGEEGNAIPQLPYPDSADSLEI